MNKYTNIIKRFDSIPLKQDHINVKSNAQTVNMLLLTCQPFCDQTHVSYVKHSIESICSLVARTHDPQVNGNLVSVSFTQSSRRTGKVKKEKIFLKRFVTFKL